MADAKQLDESDGVRFSKYPSERITRELPETEHVQILTQKLHERDVEIAELRRALHERAILATDDMRFDGAMNLLVAKQSAHGAVSLRHHDVTDSLAIVDVLLGLIDGEAKG